MADEVGARGLTGIWQGLYSYADIGEPTPFTATLFETGSSFGGSTHETCATGPRSRATLCALVEGQRRGRAVTFTKIYDGAAGWDHAIAYEGAMNADGTEVEGRWRVPGGGSGRFLMTRPVGKALAIERRTLAKV